MSTAAYTILDPAVIADPHGYRVASRIKQRGTRDDASEPAATLTHQREQPLETETTHSSTTSQHGRSQRVGELAALIDGMRHGDERALEELYDSTVGKLFALASAILRNAEDAEEIVCTTYSYAWANAARFDSKRANPLGWLLMLCRSRALDLLRKRRLAGSTLDIEAIANFESNTEDQPDDLLAVFQQRSRVREALNKLSPERRQLISLAFLQGLSHQEIAAASGMALGTIKSHVRRALVQLRDELEIE